MTPACKHNLCDGTGLLRLFAEHETVFECTCRDEDEPCSRDTLIDDNHSRITLTTPTEDLKP